MTDELEGMLLTPGVDEVCCSSISKVGGAYFTRKVKEADMWVAKAQLAKALPLLKEQYKGWKSPEELVDKISWLESAWRVYAASQIEQARQDERRKIADLVEAYFQNSPKEIPKLIARLRLGYGKEIYTFKSGKQPKGE